MKQRDPRWNNAGSSIEKVHAAQEESIQRARALVDKMRARASAARKKLPEEPSAVEPVASALLLPPVRLYHLSDKNTEVHLVAAARDAVTEVAHALLNGERKVILTWPDKINRPLALTVAALLRAQSFQPRLQALVTYYPFSERSTIGLKSLYLDEEDIAKRYHELMVGMDASEYGTTTYRYAYLLKSLRSAQIVRTNSKHEPVVARPHLREMIPILQPNMETLLHRYSEGDAEFLKSISSKRTLLHEAAAYRAQLASIENAAIAIVGLPGAVDECQRCFKSEARLSNACSLLVVDATGVEYNEKKAWIKNFKRLHHIAGALAKPPAVVVLAADPVIAKRALEIMNGEAGDEGQVRRPVKSTLRSLVKILPNDFSTKIPPAEVWQPITTKVYLKEKHLADVRIAGLTLIADLRRAGYDEAADATMAGLTYIRTIACLPFGFDVLRKHLDAMEAEGALSAYVAARYRHADISALLRKAADRCDSLSDRVLGFRDTIAQLTMRYAESSEIAELVHGLLDKALHKGNRTIIAFRDRVILHAFDSWLYEQEAFDLKRFAAKILLTTTDALNSTLSTAVHGAPIDTLLLVHPNAKTLQRVLMSPTIPKKLMLIGDGGALGSVRGMFAGIQDLLPRDPAARVSSILAGLNEHAEQLSSFDPDKVIVPEFKSEMTLDFTVQESDGVPYVGPIVEIFTDDGYRLRLLPHSDCLVRQDDDVSPFKRTRALDVRTDDCILVLAPDLHERLESLIGSVPTKGTALLAHYHQAVHDRLELMPGSKQNQAREILQRMHEIAERNGDPGSFGINELGNVLRWISAGRVEGRPDAPRSQRAFGYFMTALQVAEPIAAQYWHNAIVSSRVMAIQAGLQTSNRSQEFVLNSESFLARHSNAKPALRQLWEEMVRRFSTVVNTRILEKGDRKERLP